MGAVKVIPAGLGICADVDHDPEVSAVGGSGGALDLAVVNAQAAAEGNGGGEVIEAISRARHEEGIVSGAHPIRLIRIRGVGDVVIDVAVDRAELGLLVHVGGDDLCDDGVDLGVQLLLGDLILIDVDHGGGPLHVSRLVGGGEAHLIVPGGIRVNACGIHLNIHVSAAVIRDNQPLTVGNGLPHVGGELGHLLENGGCGVLNDGKDGMQLLGLVSAGVLHAEGNIVVPDLIHVGEVALKVGGVLVGLRDGADEIHGVGLPDAPGIVDVPGRDHGGLTVADGELEDIFLSLGVGHGNVVGTGAVHAGLVKARHVGGSVGAHQAVGGGEVAARLNGIGDLPGAARHGDKRRQAQGQRRQTQRKDAADGIFAVFGHGITS